MTAEERAARSPSSSAAPAGAAPVQDLTGGQHAHPGSQEPKEGGLGDRTNRIRASVLGANDGIVSVAGIVLGVAGATTDRGQILVAGLAGLVAGALSMASGEYVSVSSQRDTEQAALEREKRELREDPRGEQEELAAMYEEQGVSPHLAHAVAAELHAEDPLTAHARMELGIDPDELVSPWGAAISSFISFTIGALLPLLSVALVPVTARFPATFVAMLVALALTGWLSARLGDAPVGRALARNVLGGAVAMAATYGVGRLVGIAV